jgi:translation initiation factor IF-3
VRRWTLLIRPPSFSRRRLSATGGAISTDETRINDRIRARQVRLIGSDGTQYGVKALPEALQIAREQGLDLVEVAAAADPPVCKIMDHGKYKYEQDQRRKESKRKASNVVIKEMKFRPKIDGHDYTTKMKHVERFLEEGSKVKLTIMFRGREMAHPELGRRILERVAEQVGELAIIESSPKLDGRNMTMVLNPTRRPKGKGQGASKGAPKSGGHGSDSEPGAPVEAPAQPAGAETPAAESVAAEPVVADATA